MTDYKLIYDIDLPTTNQIININRSNRFGAADQKKIFTRTVSWQTRSQLKEQITKKVDLYCHWYRKDKRTDKDNISGGLKFILDGLQEAGVIKNDGWKEIGDIHHYFYVDKENPRVEIELKEVEG